MRNILSVVGRCIERHSQLIIHHRSVMASSVRHSHSRVVGIMAEELKRKSEENYLFKNVSLVTPKTLTNFCFNNLKLMYVEEKMESEPGIELLRNIAANYDYWIVRNHQTLLLYYRLQMMLQRIAFLKSVGLNARQKYREIQKYPPVLLFSFTDSSYEGKMVYLRGLIHMTDKRFIHLFYPVTRKVAVSKSDIEQRIETVQDHLQIKQPAIIRELLNMPCFFMEPTLLDGIEHKFIHKYTMPFQYNIDNHSAEVLPPICNLPSLGLSATKYFSNNATSQIIASLPSYKIQDILDYSYPKTNGKGTPECLSKFFIKAEKEEEKDRTGGQPLKGRRGFNMPPRQY